MVSNGILTTLSTVTNTSDHHASGYANHPEDSTEKLPFFGYSSIQCGSVLTHNNIDCLLVVITTPSTIISRYLPWTL